MATDTSSKWKDLGLASSLWSLVGSQSSNPNKSASNAVASSRITNPNHKSKRRKKHRRRDARSIETTMEMRHESDEEQKLPKLKNTEARQEFRDDLHEDTQRVPHVENVDYLGEDNDESDGFGKVELFNSMGTASVSSQSVREQKASGSMTSPAHTEKRDRHEKKKQKDKKRRSTLDANSSGDRDLSNAFNDTGDALEDEPPSVVEEAIKKDKKRRRSDATNGDGRKKRKSSKPTNGSASNDDPTAIADTSFLRREDRVEPLTSQEQHDELSISDSYLLPAVARAQRRSQSTDSRLRKDNVILAMESPLEEHLDTSGIDPDIESLAREAWTEHLRETRQQAEQATRDSADINGDGATGGAGAEAEAEALTRRRSTRQKKAKPTFFEQPLVEHGDEDGDLPSPSAVVPRSRTRSKPAASKKLQKRKKQSRPAQLERRAPRDLKDDLAAMDQSRHAEYTQGKFSNGELNRIASAIESFRSENNMEQRDVNEMIHAPGGTSAGEGHAQLWVRIFAECPDRHRQKIINITRKKFHNFVARGTWTPEQDEELTDLIGIHGQKWSHIAGLINRHPEDIRDRFRNYLVCGKAQRREAWSVEEEQLLTEHVNAAKEAIDSLRRDDPTEHLMSKEYEELIDWQNISSLMNRTRSRLQCITKWKSMTIREQQRREQVQHQEPNLASRLTEARQQIDDMPDDDKYRLVLAVQGSAAKFDSAIPWGTLLDSTYRSKWARGTLALVWDRLKQSVPNWRSKTVMECSQYLINGYNVNQELPNVIGEGFDDEQEKAVLKRASPTSRRNKSDMQARGLSSQFVTGSDAEDENAAGQGSSALENQAIVETGPSTLGEPTEDIKENITAPEEDIQIDPALTEVPRSAKKATPAKRTLSGKRPSTAQKPKRPLKQEEASWENSGYGPATNDKSARKKTKTYSKKPQRKKQSDELSLPLSSDMSDMDDIAPRLPLAT